MWFWFVVLTPFIVCLIPMLPSLIKKYKEKHKRELRLRWIFSFIYIVICCIYNYTGSEDLFIILVVPFIIVFVIALIIVKRKDKRAYNQQKQNELYRNGYYQK